MDINETDGTDDGHAGLAWHEGDMPYSPRFDDHYYSRADGRAECAHVFLDGNDLAARLPEASAFTIGELGFGTGLNALETWRQWIDARRPGARLTFVSFERYPLGADEIARALAPWPALASQAARLVEAWPESPAGAVSIDLDDQTRLAVNIGDVGETMSRFAGPVDAWYLDGFAPSRNPDMWSPDLMRQLHARTVPGGTFATYSAAGWVRRNLQAAGFAVEKRPGHAGKREMMCGHRP